MEDRQKAAKETSLEGVGVVAMSTGVLLVSQGELAMGMGATLIGVVCFATKYLTR